MLESAPIWLFAALLFAGMCAASVLGNWLNNRLRVRSAKAGGNDESYVLSGVFGLLALLLAFAFSLAVGRYEERRHLVVEEANAIGTLASRLSLLEPADHQRLQGKLSGYAAARVQAGLIDDDARWEASTEATARQFDTFASDLYAVIRKRPPDSHAILLVQALNAAGDAATARHAARSARLPGEVIGLLALFCIAGAGVLGYAFETSGTRHAIVSLTFFALLALAFATILDLDRPRGGTILVPQGELERTAAALGR